MSTPLELGRVGGGHEFGEGNASLEVYGVHG
jgi:hypothetical protein